MKILVVEDERNIVSVVRLGLEAQGFQVEDCADGITALERASTRAYDAVVLDVMLPGLDGFDVLRQLRDRNITVPVVLLTARASREDRVKGLNLGADDYLTKPFLLRELAARLHAVTRRVAGGASVVLRCGNLSLNRLTREVLHGERSIRLTAREFALLELFLANPGHSFTRAQLLKKVWKSGVNRKTNVVDVTIGRLRRKIGTTGERSPVETVRGVGFRLRSGEDASESGA